jgi:hypothetical protein
VSGHVSREQNGPALESFAEGCSTEISLGADQGLAEPWIASCDNLQPIRRSSLTSRIGALADTRGAICSALAAMADG